MGQAKIKMRAAFPAAKIEMWEARDCVDFAVALSRMTGWLLHIDWWSNSTQHHDNVSTDHLVPLRVYVADNADQIFDARGIRSIFDHVDRVLRPLAIKKGLGNGGVYTRFYGEEHLPSLPLRMQPDEANIMDASDAIRANLHFLSAIPRRSQPYMPAHKAANYAYGLCAVYAEAMRELTGLQPVALLARRFSPNFHGTQKSAEGYVHSVVLHPDGLAEDSWGKAPLSEIAARFGVIEFATSEDIHQSVATKIRSNSPDRYSAELEAAKELILLHRPD